jgi:hypothetical protein
LEVGLNAAGKWGMARPLSSSGHQSFYLYSQDAKWETFLAAMVSMIAVQGLVYFPLIKGKLELGVTVPMSEILATQEVEAGGLKV